jgi:hypothetical protein
MKFKQGRLLHVVTTDTRHKHTLTSTAMKQLLTLQRLAQSSGQNHILFCQSVCTALRNKVSTVTSRAHCV